MLTVLLLTPCLGLCGAFGWANSRRERVDRDRRDAGAQLVTKLEDARARTGEYPEAVEAPEPFSYRRSADGGFSLLAPTAGFFLPSDFFFVWNPQRQGFDEVADVELDRYR